MSVAAQTLTSNPTDRAVLERMVKSGGGAMATHWLDEAAGLPIDRSRTRRILQRLERAGLVEGIQASRSGRRYWWRITDAGAALAGRVKG